METPTRIITDHRLADTTFKFTQTVGLAPFWGFLYKYVAPHPEHFNDEIVINGKSWVILDALKHYDGQLPIWVFEMCNSPDPSNLEILDVRLPYNCYKTVLPSLLIGEPIHLGPLPIKPDTVDIPDMITVWDKIEQVIRSQEGTYVYSDDCWYTKQKIINSGILQHIEQIIHSNGTHKGCLKEAAAMVEENKNFFFPHAEDYAALQHLKGVAASKGITLDTSI